mmetsp:Transcript_80160/g.141443  ORF Transcript_80160/g.141443 Transcript_80160/m.141443 type:complete len:372 (+) Transcript_80160:30-1145(+)|eukprot:CAMPEP_0197658416 /NCGR_PEP_ID=MMETSP1338-20131121/45226_1 /TAXON_ID=43686 ORGANISM="Pelagodinium beii, Strain RCC1491" /NCGR_SAMPLE_ID=MMETSP1338 /ASSEMBLY_ACC=CAM_ASM_000754 /LENGTH=371 /DNA_ID=CAMNT_0043235001 /DNA_START=30 /DNA_END=1145 /DNA_ORIENTATION=+
MVASSFRRRRHLHPFRTARVLHVCLALAAVTIASAFSHVLTLAFGATSLRQPGVDRDLSRHAATEGADTTVASSTPVKSGGKCPFSKENMAMEGAPDAAAQGLIPGERYIAMNRFRVREGSEAQFEQRWATRDSSLVELKGFRWFCLLQRVPSTPKTGESMSLVYNYDDEVYDDDYSYVSFTIWETKKDFNSWRTGPAFKEAHGGGNVVGFVGMVINGFMTSNGPPTPAFWRGMLLEKAQDSPPRLVTGPGGRKDADGLKELEAEIFVVMNRFNVKKGCEQQFEQRWAERESKLQEASGFRFFQVLRRDQTPDDDVNYISMSAWNDRESFDNWWNSKSFTNMAQVQGTLLDGEIVRYFYEGKLVLESEQGA